MTASEAVLPLAGANASDYAQDNKTGRDHADRVIEAMRQQQNPLLLGRAVQDMVDNGRYGGVEIGFTHRIAERLMQV